MVVFIVLVLFSLLLAAFVAPIATLLLIGLFPRLRAYKWRLLLLLFLVTAVASFFIIKDSWAE